MHRDRILIALFLCAGCKPAPRQRTTEPRPPETTAPRTAQKADPKATCIDRELSSRGLNSYGDPQGTMYTGGTPLFDEKTGATTDRIEYVRAHQPEIERACASVK